MTSVSLGFTHPIASVDHGKGSAAPATNTHEKTNIFNGLRISTFHKWANLAAPQVVNAALTAGFICLGVFTSNPWLIASTAICGAIQAVSLGRAWDTSKGYLGSTMPALWATIAQIGAAYFGNILGGTSAGFKMLTGFSTAAITLASVWNLQVEAEISSLRADTVEFGDKIAR